MLVDVSFKKEGRKKRHRSLRKRIEGTSERPRLAVFRSSRHIYAQVIDDQHRAHA
jgi:large subunit ribosomal protein L18